MTQLLDVPAGRLFCFSSGEYSDYSYAGHFLALQPLSKPVFDAVIDDIKERCASGQIVDCNGEKIDLTDSFYLDEALRDHFIPTLIKTGTIIAIDCVEIHTGSYGKFEL